MITPQKNIAVFCGSSGGRGEQYLAVAREMGRALAGRGYGTVYDGAQVGMMGALADAALAANGTVIGVIPHVLEKVEITHRGLTELHITPNMHERKALIASRSDAFIALPGGIGTFEEIFEAMTWAQLRIHAKPCLFLNSGGYYDKLLEFMDHVAAEDMFRGKNRNLMLVANTVEDALSQVEEAWAAHATIPRASGLSLT